MNAELAVTLIAVVSEDGFVSRECGVPWSLPADKEHFRNYTAGKCLLVGRRTYEEMLGWFTPQHRVYVFTHRATELQGCGHPVRSVQEAVRLTSAAGQAELVVCGGGDCYQAAMPFATHLVLTQVADRLGAGVPFPAFSEEEWDCTMQLAQDANEENAYDLTFSVLQRKGFDEPRRTLEAPRPKRAHLQPLGSGGITHLMARR
jgi:dihydrofolate reductase